MLLISFSHAGDVPVSIVESVDDFTLSNGLLTAKVAKRNGGLTSLKSDKLEMLAGGVRPSGYWSHTPSEEIVTAVTIDPEKNDGERGEVSIKGICKAVVHANERYPGLSGTLYLEMRYCLTRGDHALYAYCILSHKAAYPDTAIGEARFCAKLNDSVFNWMTVDANRNKEMISTDDWNHGTELNMKEARLMNSGIHKGEVEHKYDYAAVQFETPAYGWSSTTKHVGFWLINPSMEYLSGGATKPELTAHRDSTFGNGGGAAPPTVLNYWRSSHYGGSYCTITAGETWTKVVGPFLLYCNSGPSPDEMWHDALARRAKENQAWPYAWVNGVDYPHANERATVSGQIVLNDPLAPPGTKISNLLAGLSAPDWQALSEKAGKGPLAVDWQLDAKNYEFWVHADEDGRFNISGVRPGKYTLHAIAIGVLGEFSKTEIAVPAGGQLDLGRLEWTPVRHGRQIWEIGIADRSASEFRHGDHYWQWGLYREYPKEFPDDVNFVIGKSHPRTDWNYCQCARTDRPNGTPWSITFELPQAPPEKKASLRIGIAGATLRHLNVEVNSHAVGTINDIPDNGAIRRDNIRGYWCEREVSFDAALLHAGTNVIKLTINPGNELTGIEYDYLRLEME